jgi:hypothetical protein
MLFDPDYKKRGGQISNLGSGKADQGYGLPIGVQFFGAFGSEANIIYQDKFKRQITLVDTEDAEDSGEEQEVAIAEWTRGANPVSFKWVK